MFGKDIIDCIQSEIDNITKRLYGSDINCPPIYKVSVLYQNMDEQKIILNCTHLGRTFSRVLFPRKNCYWEYENLQNVVEDLYNQTM